MKTELSIGMSDEIPRDISSAIYRDDSDPQLLNYAIFFSDIDSK